MFFLSFSSLRYRKTAFFCFLGIFSRLILSIKPSITLKKMVAPSGFNSCLGKITLTKENHLIDSP